MTDGNAAAVDLYRRLEARYGDSGWVTLGEVGDGTGAARSRRADAVVMGTWPSRGYDISGFEIKATRADWLAELKRPDKAQAVWSCCDYWWIVAAKGVAKAAEVPRGWGLMVEHGDGLRVQVQAERIPDGLPDEWRPFVASMLQRARLTFLDGDHWAEWMQDADRAGFERGKEAYETVDKALYGRIDRLQGAIDRFEKVSGVRINEWDAEQIGQAVNLLRGTLLGRLELDAEHMAAGLRAAAESLDSVGAEVKAFRAHAEKESAT